MISAKAYRFFESVRGIELRKELTEMVASENYNTRTIYSTQDKDGMTFVNKHMNYMSLYPDLNCEQYISNLKLMTKIRS